MEDDESRSAVAVGPTKPSSEGGGMLYKRGSEQRPLPVRGVYVFARQTPIARRKLQDD